jgi:hypothetical protein
MTAAYALVLYSLLGLVNASYAGSVNSSVAGSELCLHDADAVGDQGQSGDHLHGPEHCKCCVSAAPTLHDGKGGVGVAIVRSAVRIGPTVPIVSAVPSLSVLAEPPRGPPA